MYVRFWKANTDGEMLWEQVYYYDFDGPNYIYHQIGTADSGFVGVGATSGTGTVQDIWVLKLDSEGCLVENCTVALDEPKEKEPVEELTFVPNPASALTTIRYPVKNPGKEVVFLLTDIFGRMVSNADISTGEVKLELSRLPAGAYNGTILIDGQVRSVAKLMIVK